MGGRGPPHARVVGPGRGPRRADADLPGPHSLPHAAVHACRPRLSRATQSAGPRGCVQSGSLLSLRWRPGASPAAPLSPPSRRGQPRLLSALWHVAPKTLTNPPALPHLTPPPCRLFETVSPLLPDLVGRLSADIAPFCSVAGMDFSPAGADAAAGGWRNYFVGLVGSVSADEDDILWPNQVGACVSQLGAGF